MRVPFVCRPALPAVASILAACSLILGLPQQAAAATLTVCASGCAYSDFQQALNASKPSEPAKEEPVVERAKVETVRTEPVRAANAGDSVSKLIVGPDIKLKGAEITDCDTLVVEGRVEASMDSRAIQIAERGVFVGTCGVDVAEIRGSFEGELTVRKQLVIRATGRISGKIRYGKVAIEEGGELSGDIASIGAADKSSDSWKNSAAVMPKQAVR